MRADSPKGPRGRSRVEEEQCPKGNGALPEEWREEHRCER